MELVLKEAMQGRKHEISNVIGIVTHLAGLPLSGLLSATQQKAVLKDRIDQIASESATNAALLNNASNCILASINSLLGTSYNLADLESGSVAITALRDGIISALYNKKVITYRSVNLAPTGDVTTSSVGVLSLLENADVSDWDLAINGGHGAPYGEVYPVPVENVYSEKSKVSVATASGLPVFSSSGFKIVGYISAYTEPTVTITWGYITTDSIFIVDSFPASLYPGQDFVVTIPLKSNLGILPLDIFQANYGDGGDSGFVSASDLNEIRERLANNGISDTSQLQQVFGLSAITVAQFTTATTHVLLNPAGYVSVSDAIIDILDKIQQARDTLASHMDSDNSNVHHAHSIAFTPTGTLSSTNVQETIEILDGKIEASSTTNELQVESIERINNYLGKVDVQNIPLFTLFGDERDRIVHGNSIAVAINAINRAFYLGNIIHVAQSGGHFLGVPAAITAINTGKFGTPSVANPFVIRVAPGIYNGSFGLPDYVHLTGHGPNITKIIGGITISSNTMSSISNLSITHNGFASLDIGVNNSNKKIVLENLRVENTLSGMSLRAWNNSIILAHNVYFETVGGIAVDINSGSLDCDDGYIYGMQAINISGNGIVNLNCEAQALGPTAITISSGKLHMQAGCSLISAGDAIDCRSGELKLFGGEMSGNIFADNLSTVYIGSTHITGSLNISSAIVRGAISGRGVKIEDSSGHFAGTVAEDIFNEIGFGLQQHSVSVAALNNRANLVEEDIVFENAAMVLGSLPPEYSLVLAESFRLPSNEYFGPEAAVVDEITSVLRHSGVGVACIYKQSFVGNVAGKSKVIFKKVIGAGPAIPLATGDYEVDILLEVSGGRYAGASLLYRIQKVDSTNIILKARSIDFLDLQSTSPIEGVAQYPVLQADESVAIKILIKKDSGVVEATPVIRSFAAFI